MDEYLGDAFLFRHAQQRIEMCKLRVHASLARQPQQMQAAPARVVHGGEKHRVPKEFTGGNHHVDARDVHLDDASGSDIQMADLAIAHLAIR